MKIVASLILAGAVGFCAVGSAEALPVAPASAVSGALQAPVVEAAMVVTKRVVRRGPFGGRVVTKRVVRHGPMGRTVTTTRTVR